jgi:Cu-Zn family superoxide dismutase
MKLALILVVMLTLLAMPVGIIAQDNVVARASATLFDKGGHEVGYAHFTQGQDGVVHIDAHVNGLSPGEHGIHIHSVGSCSPSFAAAGDHYNPGGKHHGLKNPEGPHAGDLPNLVVGSDRSGRYNVTTDRVTLTPGPATLFDSDGSALVIHANPDDQVTDPAGNSGDRIACGVIMKG